MKIKCVICGGVACVFQGVSRVTADIDLQLQLDRQNLERFVEIARRFDLRLRVPEPLEALYDPANHRRWVEEKHAKVFTLISDWSMLQVDVFLDYPLSYDELAAEADSIRTEVGDLRISSKRHLLAVKRAIDPPRPNDLLDIQALERLLDDQAS